MTYLSGPMTGIEGFNFPAFNAMAVVLRMRGEKVFNPACHPLDAGLNYADFLKLDIQALLLCDKIYMLKGWENSKGATLEKSLAEALGYEVEIQE